MPFLTYNGITIPVAKGGEMDPVERGTRGRSPSNRYFLGRNGKVARRWRFTTIPLPMDQARILEAALMHEGDHWQFTLKTDPDGTSTLASDFASDHGAALTTANDVVASARGADGALVVNEGGAGAVPRESATGALGTIDACTNLLTAAQADPETSADLIAVGGATLSTETDRRWKGTGCVQVAAAAGADGARTSPVAPSGAGGDPYHGSVHLRGDAGGETVRVIVGDNGPPANSTEDVTLAIDKWTRVAVPHTDDPATTALQIEVIAVGGAMTFYADGLQLEQNDTLTAWQDPSVGARSGPSLAYPTNLVDAIGRGSFTVNAWYRRDNPQATARHIVRFGDAAGTTFALLLTGADDIRTEMSALGGSYLLASAAATAAVETWGMVTTVFDASVPSLTLYQDGALSAPDMTPGALPPNYAANSYLTVGNLDGSGVGPGHIADVSIIAEAVPAATVAQWYQSGSPTTPSGFAAPALAEGDFLPAGEGPIAVYGQLTKANYEGIHRASVFASNNRVVSFVLEEAL